MQLSSLAQFNSKQNFAQVLKEALKSSFFYLFVFSGATNLLMLISPIYSLQVFDRVMSSGSIETLLAISLIAAFLFIMYGVFNVVREYMLIKLSSWLDKRVSEKIFKLSINHSGLTGEKIGTQFFNDAQAVKGFVTSPTIFSAFDLPWSFVFIFVIYLISPQIALLVSASSAFLFLLTYIKEFRNKDLIKETGELNSNNMRRIDEYIRMSETVDSMGMMKNVYEIWAKENDNIKERVEDTSKFSCILNSISKSFRMLVQTAITGYGVYLALQHEMSFGGIIACSTLAGRAMAPFDAIMSVWSNISNVRDSYNRLTTFFDSAKERPEGMTLDKPTGKLELEKAIFTKPGPLPGTVIPIIKDVSLSIEPGEVVGVIGPSAAGKSTLVKMMAGIYKPYSGLVKIDGGDVFQRSREDVGQYMGYLSQTIDLMRGTIRDNICRFDPNAKDEDVLLAAKKTGVHDLVLSFGEGYNTVIGDGKVELSGGQRQRVALARAFYGDPRIIILDEPNANLDDIGERMLINAIINAKKEGRTVIMISHKPAIVNVTDKLIVIKDGSLLDFGTTRELMGKFARTSAQQQNLTNVLNEVK